MDNATLAQILEYVNQQISEIADRDGQLMHSVPYFYIINGLSKVKYYLESQIASLDEEYSDSNPETIEDWTP